MVSPDAGSCGWVSRLFALLAVGLLSCGTIFVSSGQLRGAWAPGEWALTPAFASQHVFRGIRLGGASAQPGLEFSAEPLAVGIWANLPFKRGSASVSGRELDLYARYAWSLGPAMTASIGFTWYHYSGSDRGTGFARSAFEPHLGIDLFFAGIRLTPRVYYDFDRRGATAEFSAAYALPLLRLGTELDFAGTIGSYRRKYDAAGMASAVTERGDYWQFGIAIPYSLGGRSTVRLGWDYIHGFDSRLHQSGSPPISNPAAGRRGVITAALMFGF